jgi:hypothetical protein
MNLKYRFISLTFGWLGLGALLFQLIVNMGSFDPAAVLCLAIPDIFFFYVAYKTYPAESN